jgi:hypothetical protein
MLDARRMYKETINTCSIRKQVTGENSSEHIILFTKAERLKYFIVINGIVRTSTAKEKKKKKMNSVS